MGTLFNGHTYTFKKDGSDLVLLDSTDHSHETITFRKGVSVSGSGISIKAGTNSVGIKGYATNAQNGDLTYQLVNNSDDGYFELFANEKTFFRAEASQIKSSVLSHQLGESIGTTDSPYSAGGYVNLELGKNRGDDGGCYIDLIGDTTYQDYGLRLIRWGGGANSETHMVHRGTGDFKFSTSEQAKMYFASNGNYEVETFNNKNQTFQIQDAYMYFKANAPSNHCFSFHNDGNNTNRYLFSWVAGKDDGSGTNYYVYARNGSGTGSIGSIRGTNGTFAIFAFTGVHDAKILQSDSKTADIIETGTSDNNHYPLGTILVNVKSEIVTLNDNGDPNMQPETYIVSSSLHQDKRVLGVYFGNANDEERPHYESVAAIGDGAILVCSENGNIENGDYITTASGSGGYGCKQNDDLLHNYTVAKSLEDVDWSTEVSSSKLIACTYHCG